MSCGICGRYAAWDESTGYYTCTLCNAIFMFDRGKWFEWIDGRNRGIAYARFNRTGSEENWR